MLNGVLLRLQGVASTDIPWVGVYPVEEAGHFAIEGTVGLFLFGELLSRNEGWILKVELTVRPILPGLPCIDD